MEPTRTVDVTFLAPLDKFHTDLEQLAVGGQVVLRRVTDEDRQLFRAPFRWTFPPPEVKYDFVLETTAPSPERTFDAGEAMERFQRVVTAFRLIKRGAFELPVLLACQTESRAFVGAFHPFVLCVVREPYSFGKEDADELRNVVRQLCGARLNERQKIALRRFDMACERDIAEDRLIDYWVALEALFSPADRRELSYRIALRAAYFTGSSPAERENIYVDLGKYYDTRSDIIHGRKPKQDVKAAAEAVGDYLRRALRKVVSDPAGFQPDQLDRVVARGQFDQGAP